MRKPASTVAAVAAAIALLAGCTTNPMPNMVTDLPASENTSTTTPAPTTGTSTTTSTSPSSPDSPTTTTPKSSTSTQSDRSGADEPISDKEAADRKAAEQAWITYDTAVSTLWDKPESTWKAVYRKHAVEPILTKATENLKKFVAAGKGNYGQVVHHPYWQLPIDGHNTATMMDCVDASNAGVMDAKTGKKLTGGVEHDNTLISLVKNPDGWKVADVRYMVNVACPGVELSANQEASAAKAASSSQAASSKADS